VTRIIEADTAGMPAWSVATATVGDAEAIACLLATCMPDPWSASLVAQGLAHGNLGFLVRHAEAADRLLGCSLVRIAAAEVEILQLAVEPTSRGRGLGGFILRAAIAGCVRRGVRTAFLEVRVGNAAARGLYRGAGFAEVGVRQRYYRDGEDAILMRQELRFPLPTG
jgi:ribosomal-protein-alanine acetyltransferase